jgi:4,5-DOPA dioxygenase extradiol
MAETMPAIFFGYGNPMNAPRHNSYTEGWRRIGEQTSKPKAILSISTHWYVPETGITISTAPRTIHDFGGFPPELCQVQSPAPYDPELARRVQQMLAPLAVKFDNSWGLDHSHGLCCGTYILMPTSQSCSLASTKSSRRHFILSWARSSRRCETSAFF